MSDQQTPEFDWQEWIERMQGAVDAMYGAMVVRFAPIIDALAAIANDPKFTSVFEKYAEGSMTEQTDQPLTDDEFAALKAALEVLSYVHDPGEIIHFDAQTLRSIGRDVRRLVAEIERLRAQRPVVAPDGPFTIGDQGFQIVSYNDDGTVTVVPKYDNSMIVESNSGQRWRTDDVVAKAVKWEKLPPGASVDMPLPGTRLRLEVEDQGGHISFEGLLTASSKLKTEYGRIIQDTLEFALDNGDFVTVERKFIVSMTAI